MDGTCEIISIGMCKAEVLAKCTLQPHTLTPSQTPIHTFVRPSWYSGTPAACSIRSAAALLAASDPSDSSLLLRPMLPLLGKLYVCMCVHVCVSCVSLCFGMGVLAGNIRALRVQHRSDLGTEKIHLKDTNIWQTDRSSQYLTPPCCR